MTVSSSHTQQTRLLFKPHTMPGRQRILALSFPYLATDRIARRKWGLSWRSNGHHDRPPVVCCGRDNNTLRLTALNAQARRLGLKPGQGMAEALAIHPALEVHDQNKALDRRFLEAVADWCDRYTPLVAIDGDDGLFLDITGCAHLFNGEQALLDDVLLRLGMMGLEAQGAISPFPGLSSALARFGSGGVLEADNAGEALTPLPVGALRLDGQVISGLKKMGLKRIGDILTLPRAPLVRRFGPGVLLRLDQALGMEDEPISPRRPVAQLSVERRLSEPVQSEADILALARDVCVQLKPMLEERGTGGRLFELLLFRVDGRVFCIKAGASLPLRDPQRIAALFSERLSAVHDDMDAGFGFEILRINVLRHESFTSAQGDLCGDEHLHLSLAEFTDRVTARLGPDSLQSFQLRESHRPERAFFSQPACQSLPERPKAKGMQANAVMFSCAKPLRIFAVPEPVETFAAEVPDGPPLRFRWRRILYRVARAEGPERLGHEWWLHGEDKNLRDYFRIEDEDGYRFWLFRQGEYGNAAAAPRWFMHGLFP